MDEILESERSGGTMTTAVFLDKIMAAKDSNSLKSFCLDRSCRVISDYDAAGISFVERDEL